MFFEQELSTLQGILLILLSLQSLLVVLRHLLRDDDAIDDGGNGALFLRIREVRVPQSLLDSGEFGIAQFMGETDRAIVDLEKRLALIKQDTAFLQVGEHG